VPRPRSGQQYFFPRPKRSRILRVKPTGNTGPALTWAPVRVSSSRLGIERRTPGRQTIFTFASPACSRQSLAVLQQVFGSGAASVTGISIRAKQHPALAPGNYAHLPQRRIKFLGRMRAIKLLGKERALPRQSERSASISLRTAPPQFQSFKHGRERNTPACWRGTPSRRRFSIRRLISVHAALERQDSHPEVCDSHSGSFRWATIPRKEQKGRARFRCTQRVIGDNRWVVRSRAWFVIRAPMQPVENDPVRNRRAKSRIHAQSRTWQRHAVQVNLPGMQRTYTVVKKTILPPERSATGCGAPIIR